MKIKTTLPYNLLNLLKLQLNGAIVNAADINFTHIPMEKQVLTALIYIKNTNTDVDFIFLNNMYDIKLLFLIKYITKKYVYNSKQFIETWFTILFKFLNKQYKFDKCILTDDLLDLFILKNFDMCKNLLEVILSLPYFCINTLKKLISKINENNVIYFNNNIINFLEYDLFIDLFDINLTDYNYSNYTKIFNEYNTELHKHLRTNVFIGFLVHLFSNNELLMELVLNI